MKEKKDLIQKALEKNADIEQKKQLKQLELKKVQDKNEVLMQLKLNFKHITGMWPKTAKFESEEERMLSWQTTSVIKQKIYQPSKTLLKCAQGADSLQKKEEEYEQYLRKFRRRQNSAGKKRSVSPFRGS